MRSLGTAPTDESLEDMMKELDPETEDKIKAAVARDSKLGKLERTKIIDFLINKGEMTDIGTIDFPEFLSLMVRKHFEIDAQ